MNLSNINYEKAEIQKQFDAKFPGIFPQIFIYVNGEIIRLNKNINGVVYRIIIMSKS
jgi:hypothetical protein